MQRAVKKALRNCAQYNSSVEFRLTRDDEPTEIFNVLGYILVDWPFRLNRVILSQEDLTLLSSYAMDAQIALALALNSYQDNQSFRMNLREFWLGRVQRFYNGNNPDYPYPIYRYTRENPRPHIDEIIFSDESSRNPHLPQSCLKKILNIHFTNCPIQNSQIDIYADYLRCGITSAELYFENHIDQFYRILFFNIELRARSISTSENIPEEVAAILYNDDVYRDYLLRRRQDEIEHGDPENFFVQNLKIMDRVWEEDLIMLHLMPALSRSSLSTSTTTTTTTTDSTIDTTTHRQWKKTKGFRNSMGKFFRCNKYRRLSEECHDGSDDDDRSHKKLRMDTFQGYTYSTDNFPAEEGSVVSKLLAGMFESLS